MLAHVPQTIPPKKRNLTCWKEDDWHLFDLISLSHTVDLNRLDFWPVNMPRWFLLNFTLHFQQSRFKTTRVAQVATFWICSHLSNESRGGGSYWMSCHKWVPNWEKKSSRFSIDAEHFYPPWTLSNKWLEGCATFFFSPSKRTSFYCIVWGHTKCVCGGPGTFIFIDGPRTEQEEGGRS